MDSHEALRHATAAHLSGRGIRTPQPPDACFESSWTTDEWLGERDAMTTHDGDLDKEDAGLMLCLVSQRFPAPPPLESRRFSGWLDELWQLSSDAPEWAEVDAFTKWVRDVHRAKRRELFRWRADAIAHICDDILARFNEDLRYLNVDPAPWARAVEQRPRLAGPAHALARTLQDALEAYQPVRPQADSREEELERSKLRGLREDDILGLVAEWEELTAQPDPVGQPAPEADGSGGNGVQTAGDPSRAVDEDQQGSFDSLKAEHEQVQHELARPDGTAPTCRARSPQNHAHGKAVDRGNTRTDLPGLLERSDDRPDGHRHRQATVREPAPPPRAGGSFGPPAPSG